MKHYIPHQGAKECARRVRMFRLESKPRRLWECTWIVDGMLNSVTVVDSKRLYVAKVAKANGVSAVLLP